MRSAAVEATSLRFEAGANGGSYVARHGTVAPRHTETRRTSCERELTTRRSLRVQQYGTGVAQQHDMARNSLVQIVAFTAFATVLLGCDADELAVQDVVLRDYVGPSLEVEYSVLQYGNEYAIKLPSGQPCEDCDTVVTESTKTTTECVDSTLWKTSFECVERIECVGGFLEVTEAYCLADSFKSEPIGFCECEDGAPSEGGAK